MDMTVKMVLGSVFLKDKSKSGEAPVGEIFAFVYPFGWGVGHQDIEESSVAQSGPVQLREKPQVFEIHVSFGILVNVTIVPVGTFQSGNDAVAVNQDPFVEICTSSEVAFPSGGIMIAVDEKEGNVQVGNDEIEIMFRKVATGDHTLHVFEFCLTGGAINQGIDVIADGQYFHQNRLRFPCIWLYSLLFFSQIYHSLFLLSSTDNGMRINSR